jgi:hypothetical protein
MIDNRTQVFEVWSQGEQADDRGASENRTIR